MKLATCHPNRKHQARGLCGACYLAWSKANNPAAREKYNAYQKEYRAKNADAINANVRKRRKKQDPRKKRDQLLRRKYGITIDDYERMLDQQGGGCKICSRKPGKLPLHVDHCHETGLVRGLLCHQCNWYLGTIEGGPDVLKNLLSYLEVHGVLNRLQAQQS